MRRTLRPALLLLVLASPFAAAAVHGQGATRQETVVIVGGQEPASPIPTLLANSAVNRSVSDLLFLPLARLGPENITSGDKGFVPQLARSWTRRDSLTLVFEMDPRARWQDGTPVTARDAALAINLARDPAVDAQSALLLRLVAEATATDDSHLVVRFTEPYDEQLYDAVYHVYPLPAHLVDTIPRGALAKSAFAAAPVGNGPYRWTRRVPKQQLELAAYDRFFLGKPGPRRVLYLTVGDAEARMNLLLSGDADVLAAPGTVSSVARVTADKRVRVYPMPTTTVGYLSFNQRDPADLSRPHPILSDPAVRTAIVKALDRRGMVQATFGPWASVPEGPVPQLFWIRDPGFKPAAADPAGARAQLRARGWIDSDGDGVLDKNGTPLALTLNYPSQDADPRPTGAADPGTAPAGRDPHRDQPARRGRSGWSGGTAASSTSTSGRGRWIHPRQAWCRAGAARAAAARTRRTTATRRSTPSLPWRCGRRARRRSRSIARPSAPSRRTPRRSSSTPSRRRWR